MRIFIAGICGTFMGGIAQLARAMQIEVRGCDTNVYPPMSTLLNSCGIEIFEGYDPAVLDDTYDQIIIGNALSRGNPMVETVLDNQLPIISGPQWLHDNLLTEKHVVAVAGTHGKTTTSAIVNWIMYQCGMQPGYLIGGKPGNFDSSASLGKNNWFVIEADEYDTAFFDKRSKFVHYNPRIAVLSNIEFDHADIFTDINQIKTQFHHLVRIVPSSGTIVANRDDINVADVLKMGCWSELCWFSIQHRDCQWFAKPVCQDCSQFDIYSHRKLVGNVEWSCIGRHNMQNGLAAIAASQVTGIEIEAACKALRGFTAAARRLQLLYSNNDVYLYEDFAHHPTAISLTIEALQLKHPDKSITVIVEFRSNTMKHGHHGEQLGSSFDRANSTYIYQPTKLEWEPESLVSESVIRVVRSSEELLGQPWLNDVRNSVIVCMSNGGFDGIPSLLREHLESNLVKIS